MKIENLSSALCGGTDFSCIAWIFPILRGLLRESGWPPRCGQTVGNPASSGCGGRLICFSGRFDSQ